MKYFKHPSQEFVYTRTYARWIEAENRRETWPETVGRYVNFIKEERGDKIPAKVLRKIENGILEMKVMPSMRALWTAGPAAKRDNTGMYNCSFLSVDNPLAFSEGLFLLMAGAGLGFGVQKKDVEKLPVVPSKINSDSPRIYAVGDSREGWADSVKELINTLYSGNDLLINYNAIRPSGVKLKTFGGTSSGPAPLAKLHEFIRQTFYGAQGRKLTSLECHDIMNELAIAVIAGNVRRSAEISLSDLDDEDMRFAKTGNFPNRRWMANNSAIYDSKPSSAQFLKEWSALAESGTGERGIYNRGAAKKNAPKRRNKDLLVATNPCISSDSLVLTKQGYVPIVELVGKKVEIWNGFEWSEVEPKVTGENQRILRVKFSNGESLKCTYYHKFYLKDPTKEATKIKKAIELEVGDTLIPYELPWGFNKVEDKIKFSNVSVIAIDEFGIEEKVYCFNEPKKHMGVFNNILTGQCGEISLRNREKCNLSEVIVTAEDDLDSLLEKIETATWLGAIQSTFTYFPYLSKQWEENANEERLLGVSLTGQMDNPKVMSEDNLKALKSRALKVAKKAADILGVNFSTSVTCVKPSGTVSALVNSSSGLHPRFDNYYIRRYRISSLDPLFRMIRSQGIKLSPENGQSKEEWDTKNPAICHIYDGGEWDESKVNTWVLEFPMAAPEGAIVARDLTAIQQLEYYKKVQDSYCEHNASITVYVKEDEWLKVGSWVYDNWDTVVGVSFLPYSEHKYKQAPYESITKEQYEELMKNFKEIDYSDLTKFELEDQTEGAKTFACVGGGCDV